MGCKEEWGLCGRRSWESECGRRMVVGIAGRVSNGGMGEEWGIVGIGEECYNIFPSLLYLCCPYQLIYCFHANKKNLFEDGVFSGELLICTLRF